MAHHMDRASRHDEILDIARDLMAGQGVESTTMLQVANAAGASKETLYSWFRNKEGLIQAICLREANAINSHLEEALNAPTAPLQSTLERVAVGLMQTLLGEWSLAINRAAMQSPRLAETLLNSGRFVVGPMVARYLESRAATGEIRIVDGDTTFRLFFGMVMQDMQIRALLYNQATPPSAYASHARNAVEAFLELVTP